MAVDTESMILNYLKRYNFFIFLLFLLSCTPERNHPLKRWLNPNGKLKVLSTTAMIGDIVRQVGGSYIDEWTLIQGELDPHSYQLVKGDDEKFANASLIFYNGLGLEHGPSLQYALQNSTKAVSLGNCIAKMNPTLILYVNGKEDPHIWMDVNIWSRTIPWIVKALEEKDPENAPHYRKNGEALIEKFRQIDQEILATVTSIPPEKRYLVTSHDAFNYFARAYLATEEEKKNNSWHERFQAPEGLAPESQLSTTDIQAIIDHVKRHHIHLLFTESNISHDSIQKIFYAGKEKGLELKIASPPLYGDAMGPAGSPTGTYEGMMLYNAHNLKELLK